MNASELIELLRKHPKACRILGITEEHMAFPWTPETRDSALRWITVGKCVEWCDAHGYDVRVSMYVTCDTLPPMFAPQSYAVFYDGPARIGDDYPTRLHAMLAAMGAHDRLGREAT